MRSLILNGVRRVFGPIIHRHAPFEQSLLNQWYRRRSWFRDIPFRLYSGYWIREVYLREPNPDRREALKALAMGSTGGAEWARSYQSQELCLDAPVGSVTLREAVPLYADLLDYLQQAAPTTVIQIGSCSGRELCFFARQCPQHYFMGIDPFPDVVEVSRAMAISNTAFFTGTAQTIQADLVAACNAMPGVSLGGGICFSIGCLLLVQPEHVQSYFAQCARLGIQRIYVSEAVEQADAVDLLGRTESRWRGGFAYTHPYRYFGEREGYTTKDARIIHPYGGDAHSAGRNVCHYYWVGELAGS